MHTHLPETNKIDRLHTYIDTHTHTPVILDWHKMAQGGNSKQMGPDSFTFFQTPSWFARLTPLSSVACGAKSGFGSPVFVQVSEIGQDGFPGPCLDP